MKQIKKVILKDATRLSHEEMKNVFGGSGTGDSGSFCYLKCGKEEIDFKTDKCTEGCGAAPGNVLLCMTSTTNERYWCDNGIILSSIQVFAWEA